MENASRVGFRTRFFAFSLFRFFAFSYWPGSAGRNPPDTLDYVVCTRIHSVLQTKITVPAQEARHRFFVNPVAVAGPTGISQLLAPDFSFVPPGFR
jgi:hypothetical protein